MQEFVGGGLWGRGHGDAAACCSATVQGGVSFCARPPKINRNPLVLFSFVGMSFLREAD